MEAVYKIKTVEPDGALGRKIINAERLEELQSELRLVA